MKLKHIILIGAALAAVMTVRAEVPEQTIKNLNTAFQGESNAAHRYALFAEKADAEGYGQVAKLFRAAARVMCRPRFAIIVAHAGRNGFMRGTSRREDAANWIIKLAEAKNEGEIQGGARFVARFSKNRNTTDANCPPLEWHFNLPKGETLCRGSWKQISTAQMFRELIEDGLTYCKDLAEEMGITKGQVSKLATKAFAAGWLKKDGRDYELTGQA